MISQGIQNDFFYLFTLFVRGVTCMYILLLNSKIKVKILFVWDNFYIGHSFIFSGRLSDLKDKKDQIIKFNILLKLVN